MSVIPNDIRFSSKRFQAFDRPAKKVAKEFLKSMGFENLEENIGESTGDFSKIWDVKGIHSEIGEWRLEAEIKQDWGTKWFDVPFKYSTMDIPFRKRDKAKEHATHHIVIGGDLKRLFIVNREVVLESPISYKKVRNRGWQEEPFFNISIEAEKSSFWFIENGKWKIYK